MALQTNTNNLPILILPSDDLRLADPTRLMGHLPPGSFVLLRSKNLKKLCQLATRIIPAAHDLGHKVLLAGPIRLARTLGADGAHLNEASIKRRATRDIWAGGLRKNFILSASAHGRMGLVRAGQLGVDFVLLGQISASHSHPNARPLGMVRFCMLTRQCPVPVVAIGGINKISARRLKMAGPNMVGLAAIKMFADN